MLNVGKIEEGFVLDHIKAGEALVLYHNLGLDKLDCPKNFSLFSQEDSGEKADFTYEIIIANLRKCCNMNPVKTSAWHKLVFTLALLLLMLLNTITLFHSVTGLACAGLQYLVGCVYDMKGSLTAWVTVIAMGAVNILLMLLGRVFDRKDHAALYETEADEVR